MSLTDREKDQLAVAVQRAKDEYAKAVDVWTRSSGRAEASANRAAQRLLSRYEILQMYVEKALRGQGERYEMKALEYAAKVGGKKGRKR